MGTLNRYVPVVICILPCLLTGQDRGLIDLATSLSIQIKQHAQGPVAITSFLNTKAGSYCPAFNNYLVDRLNILLAKANTDFVVVTRNRVEEVFKEINLALAKNYDSSTFAKIGRLLGAHALVRGSYTIQNQGATVSIATQLLDVESGRIVGGEVTELPLSSDIRDLLDPQSCSAASDSSSSIEARDALGVKAPRQSAATPAQPNSRSEKMEHFGTKRVGQLEVTLKGCRIDPEGLLCEALVTNLAEERQYCLVSNADTMMSRIVDDHGNVKTPVRISLAERIGRYQMWECARLPKDIAVASTLLFIAGREGEAKPTGESARLKLVEFGFDIVSYASRSSTSFLVQFRDVPVRQ